MSTFDQELWRGRAAKRYANASDTGRVDAIVTYARDLHNIKQMAVLIDWCSRKRLSVVFNRKMNGRYFPNDKLITINCRCSPETQLYILMHECGHHLIGYASGPNERYGSGYQAEDSATKRSTVHRIDIVDEELEAWARGLKLAKRLGIKIDVNRFNHTKSEYIKTYLKWAAKVEGWKGPVSVND